LLPQARLRNAGLSIGLRWNYSRSGRAEGIEYVDPGALAQTGATVIVTAMATDTWVQIRTRIARLFAKGDTDRERAEAQQLEEIRLILTASPAGKREDAERDLCSELRGVLKERLRNDPQLSIQFASLVAEVREDLSSIRNKTTFQQKASADNGSTVYQAGRDIFSKP
jgi:hypothetical protein